MTKNRDFNYTKKKTLPEKSRVCRIRKSEINSSRSGNKTPKSSEIRGLINSLKKKFERGRREDREEQSRGYIIERDEGSRVKNRETRAHKERQREKEISM